MWLAHAMVLVKLVIVSWFRGLAGKRSDQKEAIIGVRNVLLEEALVFRENLSDPPQNLTLEEGVTSQENVSDLHLKQSASLEVGHSFFVEGDLSFAGKPPASKEKELLEKFGSENEALAKAQLLQDATDLGAHAGESQDEEAHKVELQNDPSYDELMQDLVWSGAYQGAHLHLSRWHAAKAGMEVASVGLPIPFSGTLVTAFDYALYALSFASDIPLAFKVIQYADWDWYEATYSVSSIAWALENSPLFDPETWHDTLCGMAKFLWHNIMGVNLEAGASDLFIQFIRNATHRELKGVPALKIYVHWAYALWHSTRANERAGAPFNGSSPHCEDTSVDVHAVNFLDMDVSIKKFQFSSQ